MRVRPVGIMRMLAGDRGSLESFSKNTIRNIWWFAVIVSLIYAAFNWIGLGFLGAIGT